MAKIMYGTQEIGEVSPEKKNWKRRFWQKVRAFKRRQYWYRCVSDSQFWLFDEKDTRTFGSEGLYVYVSTWTNGGHGLGDFDTRGGGVKVEVEEDNNWKILGEEVIKSECYPGYDRKWAHNWYTPLPDEEELKNEVANSPMFFQAFKQEVMLPLPF